MSVDLLRDYCIIEFNFFSFYFDTVSKLQPRCLVITTSMFFKLDYTNIHHHQSPWKQQQHKNHHNSINQLFGGTIINLPLHYPRFFEYHSIDGMFSDDTMVWFVATSLVSAISVLANICLLIYIVRNKAQTRTSKNACFGYYLFHASLTAIFVSAFAMPLFLASNHIKSPSSSSSSRGFDWLRVNGRFFKHASCTCIHSTLAAMVYQRLLCLLDSSYKRKSLLNLKLNTMLAWMWSVTSVLPEIIVQSNVDTSSKGWEIHETSSCLIVYIVLSLMVPMAIIVYSRFSVLRLRSTDSVLLVKRCREYRKFGSVCFLLSAVLVLCNLPETMFDLLRLYKFENDNKGSQFAGNMGIPGFDNSTSSTSKEIHENNPNDVLKLTLSILSWLYLPALPIIYFLAYRIRTLLTVKKRTTVFFRERSTLATNGQGGSGYQGNNSFQPLRHNQQRQLSNNNNNTIANTSNDVVDAGAIEMKMSNNTSATSKYPQKLFQSSGIFPARGSCSESGGRDSIDDAQSIGSSSEAADLPIKSQQQKGKRKLSLSILNLSNDSQSSLNSHNNKNNGNNNRRQSLFERRKSASSLDDALDECSRRFSEPNVDLNPELIASCLTTLESLYETAAHDKKSKVSSLFRQALRRFSAVSQQQKQQQSTSRGSGSSSINRHSQDFSTFGSFQSTHSDVLPTTSTSAPFLHVIHKLNQNKDNVGSYSSRNVNVIDNYLP